MAVDQHGDPTPTPPKEDVKPAGNVQPAPTGGQPATPAAATPAVQPTPGAEPKPDATTPPVVKSETGQVPITALHEERTKRQSLEREVEQLREAVTNRAYEQQVQPQQQPPQQSTQGMTQEQMNQMWEYNPRGAVQAEIMQHAAWRDAIDASVSQQSAVLQNKYVDFNEHRQTAETYVRSLPLEQRANPRVMETAYFIVRGQNVDKALEKQKADLYTQFQQGNGAAAVSTPPVGTYSAPPVTPGVQLTQEQLTAANAMGLTPEAYAGSIVNK